MSMNKILWHSTRQFQYCVAHGDTVEYRTDAESRRIAMCNVCGAKLVIIGIASTGD